MRDAARLVAAGEPGPLRSLSSGLRVRRRHRRSLLPDRPLADGRRTGSRGLRVHSRAVHGAELGSRHGLRPGPLTPDETEQEPPDPPGQLRRRDRGLLLRSPGAGRFTGRRGSERPPAGRRIRVRGRRPLAAPRSDDPRPGRLDRGGRADSQPAGPGPDDPDLPGDLSRSVRTGRRRRTRLEQRIPHDGAGIAGRRPRRYAAGLPQRAAHPAQPDVRRRDAGRGDHRRPVHRNRVPVRQCGASARAHAARGRRSDVHRRDPAGYVAGQDPPPAASSRVRDRRPDLPDDPVLRVPRRRGSRHARSGGLPAHPPGLGRSGRVPIHRARSQQRPAPARSRSSDPADARRTRTRLHAARVHLLRHSPHAGRSSEAVARLRGETDLHPARLRRDDRRRRLGRERDRPVHPRRPRRRHSGRAERHVEGARLRTEAGPARVSPRTPPARGGHGRSAGTL